MHNVVILSGVEPQAKRSRRIFLAKLTTLRVRDGALKGYLRFANPFGICFDLMDIAVFSTFRRPLDKRNPEDFLPSLTPKT